MTPATATFLAAVAAGVFAIIVAVVNAVVGRAGRRTDRMETITDSGLRLLDKVQKECDECEETLTVFRRVLRALVRAVHSGDPLAIEQAAVAAVDVLDGA